MQKDEPMATQMTKAEQRKRDETLLTIARERMLMKDLTTTKSSADFHETAVWCVKDALEAAYAAGMEAGEKRRARHQVGQDLFSAAKATLALWDKHGLGDDDAESEPAHNALAEALRDADPNGRVTDECGCPHCGETRADALVWQDDETIRCASCGRRYELNRGN